MKLLNNHWYIVLESEELKPNKIKKATRLGETIAFWRDSKNQVHATSDRCPHRGASLSEGTIKKDCITCPFHGIQFDGDGQCQHIPYLDDGHALHVMKIKSYRVTEAYGFIWLWHGEQFDGQEPVIFEQIKKGYAYYTYKKVWDTHYSRAIENQLDYYHLPFVHKNTIGRGLNPPSGTEKIRENFIVNFENNTISATMKSKRLNGGTLFKFMFPNSWLLRLSPFLFLYVAFCPIDAERTHLYLRSYIPGKYFKHLKNLMLKTSPLFNNRILSEDESVVMTQTPKEITPNMEEHLLLMDKPIAFFRNYYFENVVESKF